MVVLMGAKMLDQLKDALGEQCDLYIRRAGVGAMNLVVRYQLRALFFIQWCAPST